MALASVPSPAAAESTPTATAATVAAPGHASTATSGGLSSQNGTLAPSGLSRLTLTLVFVHVLQHGSVLQHVGQDQKPDFRPPNVDVFQLCDPAVPVGDCDVLDLAVHVVLGFDQLAAVNLASDCLASHDVTFGLVQDLDGDTDGHVGDLVSSGLGEIIRISADFSSKIRSSPVPFS